MALEEVPQKKRSLVDLDTSEKRLTDLMNNNIPEMGHDIKFLVGNTEEKISCHKFIVAAVSPVFQKMFFGQLQERDEIIKIPDVDATAFRNILKFAYLRHCEVDLTDTVVTMHAADKYQLPELILHCSDILNQNLNAENVVAIYQSATLLDNLELKTKAYEYLLENFVEVVPTPGFLDLTAPNLCQILQSDDLNVCNELDAFDAVIRWTQSKCEKSISKEELPNIASDVIKCIRFPIMDISTILEHVEPTGVLEPLALIHILKYVNLSSEKRKTYVDMKFNPEYRNSNLMVFRPSFERSETTTIELGDTAEFYFRFLTLPTESNQGIYLQEIEVDCNIPGTSEECIIDMSFKDGHGTVLVAGVKIQPNVSSTKSIRLNKKIQIIPNTEYIIIFTITKGTLGLAQPSQNKLWTYAAIGTQNRKTGALDIQMEYCHHSSYPSNVRALRFGNMYIAD